ncbi:hypothetical protein K431DRAFT_295446 [Polychaeton citri CBS 116435]|uniref:Uncharacterized protein n=1 Tax=Polychaeton citri CBS 116435 TaxID=1314669 RepID=A0A9P4UPJ1_9PEZI|nr:hypothetical protein K431DRAFT_295446 [Polychaeton citri CBS 116435]
MDGLGSSGQVQHAPQPSRRDSGCGSVASIACTIEKLEDDVAGADSKSNLEQKSLKCRISKAVACLSPKWIWKKIKCKLIAKKQCQAAESHEKALEKTASSSDSSPYYDYDSVYDGRPGNAGGTRAGRTSQDADSLMFSVPRGRSWIRERSSSLTGAEYDLWLATQESD